MKATLAEELFELFAERRREAMAKGWPEPPEWVFCSETATAPDPRNVECVWQREADSCSGSHKSPLG